MSGSGRETLDLDAFPIVRIDQVSLLDDKQLHQAIEEIGELLRSNANNPMHKYMARQYSAMTDEEDHRRAEERVHRLLSGIAEDPEQLPPRRQTIPSVAQPQDPIVPLKVVRETAPKTFDSTPLSSYPRQQKSMNTLVASEVASESPQLPTSVSSSAIGRKLQPSSSMQSVSTTGAEEGSLGTDTPRSTTSTTSRPRRPISATSTEESGPSKKSLDIVYRNFSSEFIVAATEKKRRFLPKKKVVEESVEELKAKERLERRKQAMERLHSRQAKQEQSRQDQRERRRQAKLRARQLEQQQAGDGDSSSGSESVSGGDDDFEVKVDEAMIKAVQSQVIDSNGKRTFVVAGAPGERRRKSQPKNPPANANSSDKSASTTTNKAPNRATTVRSRPPKSDAGKASTASDSDTTASSTPHARQSKPSQFGRITRNSSNNNSNTNSSASIARTSKSQASSTTDLAVATTGVTNSSTGDVASTADGNFDSKNQSALWTIRRLKEAKHGGSPSAANNPTAADVTRLSSLSAAAEEDDMQVRPCSESDIVGRAEQRRRETRDMDDILRLALEEVHRLTTPRRPTTGGVEVPVPSDSVLVPSTFRESAAASVTASLSQMVQHGGLESDCDPNLLLSKQQQQGSKSTVQQHPPGIMSQPVSARAPSAHIHAVIHPTDDNEPPAEPAWTAEEIISKLKKKLKRMRKSSSDSSAADLLQILQGTVMFNVGPDDLPGLRALQPTQSHQQRRLQHKQVYSVDVDAYHDRKYYPERAEEFDVHSRDREDVAVGLVLMCLSCHEVLLGKAAVRSVDDIQRAWMTSLHVFDDDALSVQDDARECAFYFSPVRVCGNGFAVCQKLNSIMRWYFVPLLSLRSSMSISNRSVINSVIGGEVSVADGVSDQQSGSMSMVRSLSAAVVGGRQMISSAAGSDSDDGTPVDGDDDANDDQYHQDQGDDNNGDQEFGDDDGGTNDGDDDGDDDGNFAQSEYHSDQDDDDPDAASMDATDDVFPSNTNEGVNAESASAMGDIPVGNAADLPSVSTTAQFVQPAQKKKLTAEEAALEFVLNKNKPPVNSRKQQQQASQGRGARRGNNPVGGNSRKGAASASTDNALVEYYPNFAMLFPMAYSQSSTRDDSGYARTILESMQVQAQVYEEWVEVMRDYSTVFCHPGSNADEGSAEADQKQRSASVYHGSNRALHYRVKSSRPEVFNIVDDVFRQMLPDWETLPAGLGLGLSWNLLWTWSKPRINRTHLLVWQKVNHFEESRQLTRKDMLKKSIQRFTDMPHAAAREFEIMPQTYLLPHEYNAFVGAFTSIEAQKAAALAAKLPPILNYWILKPVGLSRGRGISLIKDLGDLSYAQASVVQKYVENPLCLHGFKFDLRIYVVVTSFHPLEAFIYRDGFARVSFEAYSVSPADLENKFIHLTNSSIQKHHISGPGKDNPLNQTDSEDVGGSKISLLGAQGLWKRLEQFSQGSIQSDAVWQSICTLIVKSLVMVDDKIPHQPCSFELFGYDVLIDSDLRPWLLEVNASPSLARENQLDHRVKNALIRDIIQLLDVAPYDRAALARIMRRRLNSIAKSRHVHGRNDAELEQDLRDILGDYRPRRFGELPAQLGQFERLAPETPYHQQVLRLKKKLFKDGPTVT